MNLQSIATDAAEELNAAIEPDDDGFTFTVRTSDEGQEERTQGIGVALMKEEDPIVVAWGEVGPYSRDVDLQMVLAELRGASFARVYLAEANDDGSIPMLVEGALPAQAVNAETLAWLVQEVADLTDTLQLAIFGE